ncbi:hypothetical protein Ahy_A07g034635 [Arachis hypogaea]|uniref:BED-type domain-containing protein n=1 Tax=Arachis hypogaea TaxID=3818 RepID=A0A445CCE2_ARAHY|nr:hypothetical protein Ahy_A07g034635 [Arachis hypogaea]
MSLYQMRSTNFGIVRKQLCDSKENNEKSSKAEVFIATRTSKKGKEIDAKTQTTINELQNHIEDQPGRVRCYGTLITRSSLKKDEEIRQVKGEYNDKMSSLDALSNTLEKSTPSEEPIGTNIQTTQEPPTDTATTNEGTTNSTSGVRKRKLTSEVWNHFKIVEIKEKLKAECNYCKSKLLGDPKQNTSHLRDHFKSCKLRTTRDVMLHQINPGMSDEEIATSVQAFQNSPLDALSSKLRNTPHSSISTHIPPTDDIISMLHTELQNHIEAGKNDEDAFLGVLGKDQPGSSSLLWDFDYKKFS